MADRKYPRHDFWGAGEPDCPADLKAPNGELCDMRCKVCGDDWRDSTDVCMVALGRTEATGAKPFAKGSWQHAVDDALVEFGKTSEEFDTPHEAVAWLLGVQSEYAVDCYRRATSGVKAPAPGHGIAELCALKDREAIAANLLRFGGLNKHHARRVADALLDASGVAPHPLDALLPEICQLIDAVKAEWSQQGCWSEWDQSVRDRIAAYNLSRVGSATNGVKGMKP